MSEHITSSEFERLVIQDYQFLVDDFSFLLRKLSEWSFTLETKSTKIWILVEHASLLTVALEPIGEEANKLLRQKILPKGIEVVVVSMCLDANFLYKVRRLGNKGVDHDISVELGRRAELLKKYCIKMINGDFSDWGAIEKCMSRRAYEFLDI